jgi:hypothetical protein
LSESQIHADSADYRFTLVVIQLFAVIEEEIIFTPPTPFLLNNKGGGKAKWSTYQVAPFSV